MAEARLHDGTGWVTVTDETHRAAADPHPGTYAPATHAAAHGTAGADPITPDGIGAAAAGHNHDTAYAATSHSHTGYAAASHTHTQAQSHGTPDTDSGTTALHHTLGGGANQAAPGTHNHDTAYAATSHGHTLDSLTDVNTAGATAGQALVYSATGWAPGTTGGGGGGWADLNTARPKPAYSAHRGGGGLWPENTMEAFDLAAAVGAHTLETDVWMTADGIPVINHDAGVARTTTGTGNVADLAAPTFLGLTVDTALWGPGWSPRTVRPCTFEQFVRAYADRVHIQVEPKEDAAAQPVVDVLNTHVRNKRNVTVSSSTESRINPAKAAGYPVALRVANPADPTWPSYLASNGIEQVNIDQANVTSALVASYQAQGVWVQTFSILRHSERDAMVAAGADGIIVDDVQYAMGTARRTTDPFVAQAWHPGHISGGARNGAEPNGHFVAPNEFGFDNFQGVSNCDSAVLQGWGCPIKGNPSADTYTITFTARTVANQSQSNAAQFSIAIADHDGGFGGHAGNTVDWRGYWLLVEADGDMFIRWCPGDGTGGYTGLAGPTNMGMRSDDGTARQYRVVVSPTQITWERVGGPVLSTADTTMRGGYFHFGSGGTETYFRAVTIT